jgi:hypothetical protein
MLLKINHLLTNPTHRRRVILLLTATLAWGMTYLGVTVFQDYGVGIFCALPIFMGAFSAVLNAWHSHQSLGECWGIGVRTLLIYTLGLIVFAIEGLICIAMAAPFGFALLGIGSLIGFAAQNYKQPTAILIGLTLSVPAMMSFENIFPSTPSVMTVVTSVDINGTPDKVWDKLVAFSDITEPRSWLFKTGIAYPIRAEIKGGQGIGAVRYCRFSTGAFVEPITVWDKPNLLKFSVLEQPEPMEELSPYDLHPQHLHGYFVSTQGQFKLTDLGNGRTKLEGTTWYYHKIRPETYWRLWSDFILHSIHERVLNHIKNDVERMDN